MTTFDDSPMTDADLEVSELREMLSMERNTSEFLAESLADAQLARDDIGWRPLAGQAVRELSDAGQRTGRELCRVMAIVNPLARRALAVRTAYIWGGGVTITARDAEAGQGQDVNAVLQSFMDDEGNKTVLFSAPARETIERQCGTDGGAGFVLFTNPLTGAVQARPMPRDEITDVIHNPDDATQPWYYKREWSRSTVDLTPTGGQTVVRETVTYYPAVGYYPKVRPRTINGNEVAWDSPVLFLHVNRPAGWKFGIGDLFSALPWLRGYKEFLEDWRLLVKALSKYAWRAQSKGRGAAQVRDKLSAVPTYNPANPYPDAQVGQVALMGLDQGLEAIPKTGATIDAESGRPLAAMIAAAVDLPVTMLLGDPGITGSRATAETLDTPTERAMGMRRDLHAEFLRRLTSYVIDQAIKAPRGPLKGTATRDPYTGAEVITLAADQDRTVDIEFPDLEETAINFVIQAIVEADSTSKMPPLLTLRLLLAAFHVDDPDEWIEQMTDDQGNFKPNDVAAGQVAARLFQQGQDPASIGYGGDQPPAPAPAADSQD